MENLPQYIKDLLALEYPHSSIMPSTTPVLGFGNFLRAKVATIGINPSKAEFFDKHGNLLPSNRRRLSTSESLGKPLAECRNLNSYSAIITDCENYFSSGRYYKRWFDPLNEVVGVVTNTSYIDGTACHIDLLPWATNVLWKDLCKPDRKKLIDVSQSYLNSLIEDAKYEIILLNGRTVLDAFQNYVSRLKSEDYFNYNVKEKIHRYEIFSGQFNGARVVGWSLNLQSSRGVTPPIRNELALRVKKFLAE